MIELWKAKKKANPYFEALASSYQTYLYSHDISSVFCLVDVYLWVTLTVWSVGFVQE